MAQTVTYDPDGDALVLTTRRPEDSEFVESALFGAAESGKVIVDDDDGSIDIVGLKRLDVVESSAPAGDRRVWTAFVGTRPYRRSTQVGPVGPDAREIEIQATEINTGLSDVFVTGIDGKRLREKASTRLAWILASGYVACEDRGKVIYPDVWMDPNDYRNGPGGAVIADIATATGYDWTTLLDDEGETVPELFFDDFDRSEVYSTTAKISNAGDDDGTTIFAPDQDPSEELQRNPENVSSDAIATYAKGNVHKTKAATAAAFRTRYAQVGSSTAKTAAQAKRLATNWLNDHDEEEDTVTVGFLVNPAQVNKFRRGQRCQVKLTYAPGLTDYAWCRIATRRVTQPANHDLKYHLALDLKPQRPICTNPTEILDAHATVTLSVGAEAGSPTWAHATFDDHWFTMPADGAIADIPTSGDVNVNDGDVDTYGAVPAEVARGAGTVAFYVTAELDGTYDICRLEGTVAVGSSQWQNRPPDRIDYWDGANWIALPGGYTYRGTVPKYWVKAAGGVETTKVRQVYLQTGTPGIAGLWGLFPLGIRVSDWLAYGDAV